ncbi:MAG TPA: hypothetical protein VIJ04_13220, partial [Xanthobacteraceae bacterium]
AISSSRDGSAGESGFIESLNRTPIPMSRKIYGPDFAKPPTQPGQRPKGEIPSRALGPAARDPSLLDQVAKRDNVRGCPNCDGNQSDPTDDLVFHDTLRLYRFPPELAAVPSRR